MKLFTCCAYMNERVREKLQWIQLILFIAWVELFSLSLFTMFVEWNEWEVSDYIFNKTEWTKGVDEFEKDKWILRILKLKLIVFSSMSFILKLVKVLKIYLHFF